jgi:hypothetical protein
MSGSEQSTNESVISSTSRLIDAFRRHRSNISLISLLVANTIPLWGILFFGWDAFSIVVLYWAENLIIGFYNILKIAFVKVPHLSGHLAKLFFVSFFIIHYGGFMGVHGIFILFLFKRGQGAAFSGGSAPWPCFLIFVQLLLGVIRQMWLVMPDGMWLPLGIFLVSHGVSFVHNFLIRGEYASTNPSKLMSQPYARVVVMHIALLVGCFAVAALNSPLPLLLVLVALKTILDVKLHLREHSDKQNQQFAFLRRFVKH